MLCSCYGRADEIARIHCSMVLLHTLANLPSNQTAHSSSCWCSLRTAFHKIEVLVWCTTSPRPVPAALPHVGQTGRQLGKRIYERAASSSVFWQLHQLSRSRACLGNPPSSGLGQGHERVLDYISPQSVPETSIRINPYRCQPTPLNRDTGVMPHAGLRPTL